MNASSGFPSVDVLSIKTAFETLSDTNLVVAVVVVVVEVVTVEVVAVEVVVVVVKGTMTYFKCAIKKN